MDTYKVISPEQLRLAVRLPASKSISNRSLIISALIGGTQLPDNLSDCDDTDVIVKALRFMPDVIDIKAAGTAMRFMTAFLAATDNGCHLLTGTERMKHRPIKILVDALRHLGADITYQGEEGFPPLRICGQHLEGGYLEIDGNVSSQYISALLMIGPMLTRGLKLRLLGEIISRPYIDLTLWTMREYSAEAEWVSVDTIEVKPQPYRARTYTIENDWSAASYWYEMVALTSDSDTEIMLQGLTDGSKQGDSSVRYIFSLLGVKTTFASKRPGMPTTVTLKKNGHCVTRLEYDFINSPDLAQTVIATCCALGVHFHFTGLQTLKIKETDRIQAMKTELAKLGYLVSTTDGNQLSWNGERCEPTSSTIDTYDDHRMALAFAPLSLQQPIVIRHPEVVTKSYPQFWDHLRQAGFKTL